MNKDTIERIFLSVGIHPEKRESYKDHEIFVGDGFVSPQSFWKFQWKFPNLLNAKEFPFGAYVTFWFAGQGDRIVDGRPFVCDAFHDPQYDINSKKLARINTAIKDATATIDMKKKNRVVNG